MKDFKSDFNKLTNIAVFMILFILTATSLAEAKKTTKAQPTIFSITILTQELGPEPTTIVPADLVAFWNIIEIDEYVLIPDVLCKRVDTLPEVEFKIKPPEYSSWQKIPITMGTWSKKSEREHLLSKVGEQQIGENFSAKSKNPNNPKDMEQIVTEYAKNIGEYSVFVYAPGKRNTEQQTAFEITIGGCAKGKVYSDSTGLMEKFKQQVADDLKTNPKELKYLILYNLQLNPPEKPSDGTGTGEEPIKTLLTDKSAETIPNDATVPVEARMHFQQAMVYAKLKDYNNAIIEFSLAIEKDSKYASAYSSRAVAYMQQKKYNKALEDLTEASRLNPKDPIIYYNLTALYSLQKDKLDLALESLDKCLSLGFMDADALRKDPDLKNLRKNPEYRKTLEKYKFFIIK